MKTQSYLMSGVSVLGKSGVEQGKEEEEFELILCAKQFTHPHTHTPPTHTHGLYPQTPSRLGLGTSLHQQSHQGLKERGPLPFGQRAHGQQPWGQNQICLTSRPWNFRAKCPPLLSRDGGVHFPPALGSGPPW